MSIRTSIYDFFAYALPGGLLLFAIFWGLNLFTSLDILGEIKRLFSSEIIIVVVCVVSSYVFGHLIRPLCSFWMKLFESRPMHSLAFNEFKSIHSTIKFDIEPNSWPIWFASIRREDMSLTLEVDRMMANAYFLRGVSLFLALSFLILLIGAFIGKVHWACGVAAIILPIFSYISAKESIKFNKWFYFLIFELIISREAPYIHTSKGKITHNAASDNE